MVYRKNDGGREQNVLLISKELEANIYTYANIEKLILTTKPLLDCCRFVECYSYTTSR